MRYICLIFLGVTQLINYSREVKRLYKPQKLGLAFPRLYDVAYAETVASAFLQVLNLRIRMSFEYLYLLYTYWIICMEILIN